MDIVSVVTVFDVISDPIQFASGAAIATTFFCGKKVFKRRSKKTSMADATYITEALGDLPSRLEQNARKHIVVSDAHDKNKIDFALNFPHLDFASYSGMNSYSTLEKNKENEDKVRSIINFLKNNHVTKSAVDEKIKNIDSIFSIYSLEDIERNVNRLRTFIDMNIRILTMLNEAKASYLKKADNIKARQAEAFERFDPAYLIEVQPLILAMETEYKKFVEENIGNYAFTKEDNTSVMKKKIKNVFFYVTEVENRLERIFDYSITVKEDYGTVFRKQLKECKPKDFEDNRKCQLAQASLVKAENHVYASRNPENEFKSMIVPLVKYLVHMEAPLVAGMSSVIETPYYDDEE